MLANYGYSDASGDYYVAIDTDKCNGCGECVEACPSNILEVVPDDFDELVARIKDKAITSIGYVCTGCITKTKGNTCYICQEICKEGAIEHSWYK